MYCTQCVVTFVVQWDAHSPDVSMNIDNEHPNSLSLRTLNYHTFIEGHPNLLQNIVLCCWNDLLPFYRHYPFCTGILGQQLLFTHQHRSVVEVCRTKKKVKDCDCFLVVDDVPEKEGMDFWKQMSSKWSFTCIYGIFCPKPFHDYSLYTDCILHPACVLLSVCSLHFTLSLHFTPGSQSAVCSPQYAFYTDQYQLSFDWRRVFRFLETSISLAADYSK